MAKIKRCFRCDLPVDSPSRKCCKECERINKREEEKANNPPFTYYPAMSIWETMPMKIRLTYPYGVTQFNHTDATGL